jgi:hypothetical protein
LELRETARRLRDAVANSRLHEHAVPIEEDG